MAKPSPAAVAVPEPVAAEAALQEAAPEVPALINRFCKRVFRTRGGRMGSGMGTLLEGLWLFAVNRQLARRDGSLWELAWLPDHEYNDFALLRRGQAWDRGSRTSPPS